MTTATTVTIKHNRSYLSYDDAKVIAHHAFAHRRGKTVVVDLKGTDETCTAALAKLALPRCKLIRLGRDLQLVGLAGKADALYQICRMKSLLPRTQSRQTGPLSALAHGR